MVFLFFNFFPQVSTPNSELIMLNKLFVNDESHSLKNDREFVAQGRGMLISDLSQESDRFHYIQGHLYCIWILSIVDLI